MAILLDYALLSQSVKFVLKNIRLVSTIAIFAIQKVRAVLILYGNAAIAMKIIWQIAISVYSKQIQKKETTDLLKTCKKHQYKLVQTHFIF
jgi:hypothetical protein